MFHGLSPFWTMPAWYWHSLHVPTQVVLFRMTEQCRLGADTRAGAGSLPANSVKVVWSATAPHPLDFPSSRTTPDSECAPLPRRPPTPRFPPGFQDPLLLFQLESESTDDSYTVLVATVLMGCLFQSPLLFLDT